MSVNFDWLSSGTPVVVLLLSHVIRTVQIRRAPFPRATYVDNDGAHVRRMVVPLHLRFES